MNEVVKTESKRVSRVFNYAFLGVSVLSKHL